MHERDDSSEAGGAERRGPTGAPDVGRHPSEAMLDTFPGLADRMVDDADWTAQYASAGCAALTGWRPEDLVGRRVTYDQLIHPDDRARVRAEVHAALADLGAFELRYRLVRRDGAVREVLEHGRATRPANGGPAVLEGFVQDVTERVRTEAALRASEARFRTVARVTSDVVWEWDVRTGVVRRGAELDAPFAAADEAPRDITWWATRVHPDDLARVRAAVGAAIARAESGGDGAWSDEYRFRREDGTWAVVTDHAVVLLGDDGRASHLIGALLDVTERRQLEEQLRQAVKMEAVGRLAGGVAHDFNNLLTVIGGSTEFLLDACPPGDPRHDDVVDVRRATERARELTRQLLTFSRRQPAQAGPVDLNELVRDAERLLRRVVDAEVRIDLVLDPATPRVRADRGQLEQTLVNLVVNARDAMPAGGTITLATRPTDDGWAAFLVRDTGIGMDSATRAHIFEPFFTTKGAGRGTGLGLSTVFGIVHAAGGRVLVDSEPGAGSTFTVLLPPDASGEPAPEPSSGAAAGAGGDETVLVVEDDPRVRRLACRALESRGYRVLEAGSGDEALAVADAHAGPLHLVMSDGVLPEGGGREVVEALARRRPGLRALLMSGYPADALPGGDADLRGIPLLEKPFTVDRLAAAVRSALDAEA